MKLRVVSDGTVPSFNMVARDVSTALMVLGHDVEYQSWGEATVDDAPPNVLLIGYPYYGSIAYAQRWLGKSKVTFYCATEGLPILDAYSRRLARNMNFVAPSKYVEGMLQVAELPNVDGVVPHGISMKMESDHAYDEILNEFYPPNVKVLFVCAENGMRKGFDKLLVAMKLVKREYADVRLIMHTAPKKVTQHMVMGHYDITGMQRTLQLGPDDVWMTDMYGALTYRQLMSLYRRATIYACSSTSEGFCLPIIEAKRWDVPAVALEYLPFAEHIEHEKTGLLVPRQGASTWVMWPREQPRINFELKDYRVDDYADAILRLLTHEAAYATMRRAVRATKKRWDMFNTYPRLVDYL